MNLKLDIVYMRIWAILFIVAHHSIHIYWYWPVNTAIPALTPSYMLEISTIFKNIGLAIFTYISGMLIFYQTQKRTTPYNFINKKLKRLLLPAIVWGFLYHTLFPLYESNKIPTFINGNHLWYLPMLFTCMISSLPLVLHLKYKWTIVIGIYLIIFLFSHFNWTFIEYRLYFPIFIMGYAFSFLKEHSIFISKKINLTFLFLSCFLILLNINISSPTNSLVLFISHIIYMIAICYIASYIFSHIRYATIKKPTMILNNNAFAIYLLHQFVINYLIKKNLLLDYDLWYWNMIICFLAGIIIPITFSLIINKISDKYHIKFLKYLL